MAEFEFEFAIAAMSIVLLCFRWFYFHRRCRFSMLSLLITLLLLLARVVVVMATAAGVLLVEKKLVGRKKLVDKKKFVRLAFYLLRFRSLWAYNLIRSYISWHILKSCGAVRQAVRRKWRPLPQLLRTWPKPHFVLAFFSKFYYTIDIFSFFWHFFLCATSFFSLLMLPL